MCEASTIFYVASLVIMAAGTAYTVDANNKAADYQSKVAENNAQTADLNAEAAAQKGAIEEENHRAKVRGILGSQRNTLAANGLDISEGTPLDLMVETAAIGEADAQMLRFNSMREAWGFREQAKGYRSQGAYAKTAAKNQNTGTIISGAASMAGAGATASSYNWGGSGTSVAATPSYASSSSSGWKGPR